MDTAVCYQILGLKIGASLEEVKASYRRLARLYHPDVNPDANAREKFIHVTEAYKVLVEIAPVRQSVAVPVSTAPKPTQQATPFSSSRPKAHVTVTKKAAQPRHSSQLSDVEIRLKESAYRELQHLLKYQRFPRAVALAEGLTQRIPHDSEIRQWQAIAYQRWGRHLIKERKIDKARSYLKKALKTDPHNRALWAEVERDFRRLEQIY
ncbi:MAG: DnaJ domain-containing protein [Microcoleaceae cyanobacterium]